MKQTLKFLEKFYFSLINNKTLLKSCLQDEELEPLSADTQEKILDVTIHNPYGKKYSPPISYKKFFLRSILDVVESCGYEISDSLIEAYAAVVSVPSSRPICCYCTYIIKEDCVVHLQESSCFVFNSTTGLQTWEASKYLLEWCLENDSIFRNKSILELGSGIGLLGITIVKLCQPQKYAFSDKSSDVLSILSKNCEMNLEISIMKEVIESHQLLWGTVYPDDPTKLAPDIILGADIVFDPSDIESLVQTLKIFLIQGRTNSAFIASTIRNADTNKCFITQLDSAGLSHEVLRFQQKHIFIYNESSKFILYRIFFKNKSI